jgi:hypothetical protein
MASQYYLKRDGHEACPFGFRDLVAMVREGKLANSDLVRFSWTNEWQRADSLVGLWHMSQKTPDALGQVEALPVARAVIESVIQDQLRKIAPISDVDVRPGWMKRLLFIGSRKKTPAEIPILRPRSLELPPATAECAPTADAIPIFHSGLVENVNHSADSTHTEELASEGTASAQSDTEMSRSRWFSTVEAALASATSRRSDRRVKLRAGRLQRLIDRLVKLVPGNRCEDSWLRVGYRVACPIVIAAIVAASVENWSEEEGHKSLRGERQKATMRLFPVLGKCSTGKYVFLMADLVLATGAVTWFAAGWLESHAE